jgi:NitT/TauT family transport system permease protein
VAGLPKLFGLYAQTPPWGRRLLGLVPFLLLLAVYVVASHYRLAENPDDKILPSFGQMYDAIVRLAFTPDSRSGDYLMWQDTLSSLRRLGLGIVSAAFVGLFLGLNMGLLPAARHLLLPVTTFVSIVPPLAILPILFISFGVDELAKVMLIFIGTFPVITRDIYQTARTTPVEQTTKALTLGASPMQVVYRIVLPQIMPRLIETVRLCLGAAWLFLIASEAIAATDGLGYRIFLVRRYLAMDVIIPYVLWITLLGFTFDRLLQAFSRWRYHWYYRT